jgi:SAM-dependent methyltransferase
MTPLLSDDCDSSLTSLALLRAGAPLGMTPLSIETTAIPRLLGMTDDTLAINRAGWNKVAPKFHGGTALPSYGPLAPTEETLQLLDPIAGKRVLELGCGSGHSLKYLAEQGASEIWGLDLSPTQIAFATATLQNVKPTARLFESPMEVNPGIPAGYFDLVVSIYALGWTIDLPATLALVAQYLKPGGSFVFSGEHPAYSCLEYVDRQYVVARPYLREGPTHHQSWSGVPIVIQHRTLGTFVNEVIRAGLQLERLVESELNTSLATEAHADPARWYSVSRAAVVPTTFVLKARRPE